MIRTAICDDEANTRAYLSSLIQAQPYPCEIVEYASSGDCLADHRQIDLLFLDIELNSSVAGLDGMALARKIRDLELELQDQFFRTHKGYLVNLSYVGGYSKSEVALTNGETLLLSKYKYQDFVKAYLRFLKRGWPNE